MRRFAVVVMALAMVLAVLAPAAQAAPYCGIYWGSLAKSKAGYTGAPIVEARAGQHPCYDRLVFEVDGPAPGYHVSYVSAVKEPGSGKVVPLRGGADLRVIVRAPAYNASGQATLPLGNPEELVGVSGFRTFRQVSWGGSFEGQTTVGLGVRARLPFRVFLLDGPGDHHRLVIDVAHRW